MLKNIALALLVALAASCASSKGGGSRAASEGATPRWAIVIHGGAGVISKSMPDSVREGYLASLRQALRVGAEALDRGEGAVDVAEAVIRFLEDDPHFNAGKGAVFTHELAHELDASIMDGRTLACGAVTGVTTVRHPITLARRVMEKSPHVFFGGAGAERFADTVGVERVPNSWFDTPRRKSQIERRLAEEGAKGTVGCVVLDAAGHLAAATSTGGLTNKRFGRIGDSPVIGAGNYADDRSCAVSGTGTGEQFIRHTVARSIAARMEFGGVSLEQACRAVVFERLSPGDGGVIAVSRTGEIATVFNSPGMFRGIATSSGRFETAIWK